MLKGVRYVLAVYYRNSGAGKSGTAYENIIREASANPDRLYYVIVPEQFTMQTQKTLVEMHPDGESSILIS